MKAKLRSTSLRFRSIRYYYDPSHANFLSLDPDPGDEDDPQTQNGYNYTNNNPVNGIDPDGHRFIDHKNAGGGPGAGMGPGGLGGSGYGGGGGGRGGGKGASKPTSSAKPTTKGLKKPTSKSWMKGKKDTQVYYGIKNGKKDYVGISKNIGKRARQHGARFDRLEPVTTASLTRRQARAIEQAIIKLNPSFSNKVNSISPKRDWYNNAVKWGSSWLKKNGK